MPLHLIPSFLLYIYITAITPGPANLSSLSTALRYGKKAVIRQWMGSFLGFSLVSMSTVFILWRIGPALTRAMQYLTWLGFFYILILAFRILTSEDDTAESDSHHPGFWTGFFIQVTNIKAFMMCITSLTTYVLPYDQSLWSLLRMGLFLPFTGPMMTLVWGYVGTKFKSIADQYAVPVKLFLFYALFFSAVSLVL